jgi:hypothetical protein
VYFREQNQSWDEMFTPFIQYTIDSQDLTQPAQAAREDQREENVLDIVEVAGCLEPSPSPTWTLTKASDPIVSKVQATSSVALKAAAAKPLGNRRYQLLGVSVFDPSSHKGQKVAVKGALIKNAGESRLNVTSLQMAAASCF